MKHVVLTILSGVLALSAAAIAHASLREDVAGRTYVCAQSPHVYLLTFDARARTVDREFNREAAVRVRVIWHTPDRAEIPLETDLAEPALFVRRGAGYAYDGVPCRVR